jgi:hypothetical protein
MSNGDKTILVFQVCLLGVVTRDQPQCMLFEYMAQVRPGLPKQILIELYCPITLF